MPAGKRQSGTMLYTVVTFVFLFIVSTVLAVVFYLQTEKNKTKATTLQNQMDDLASPSEIQKIGAIVGAKQQRKSRLGTMVDYLDETTSLIVGGLPEENQSAEVKVDNAERKVKELFDILAQKHIAVESNEPNIPANELVAKLADRQFAAAVEDFNEALKNELTPEKLEETWNAIIDPNQMGPFVKQLGSRLENEADPNILLVTCEFEKGCLDAKIVYNAQKQVVGLFAVPTPAEVADSYRKPPEIVKREQPYIEIDDPNTIGLVTVVEKLKTKLDNTSHIQLAFQKELERLKIRFDDAMFETKEKEKQLLAEKEKYKNQVTDVMNDYNDLKAMLQQNAEQQVQTLMAQLEEEKDNRKSLNQQLLKTEAELVIAQERMKRAQEKLNSLVPPPDSETAAYKPDGKIILTDESTKIVHISLGSDDHVYRGLTFSVYEKNTPIPKTGKGKAEIEVFNVSKNISSARITSSNPKNPIIVDDDIANLIWDSDRTNVFVVAGEFDLNGDGKIDYDGAEKIKALIKKWGGRATDEISIDTDYLVLGSTPVVLPKPTFEQMEIDPMAMEKYEKSLKGLDAYKEVQDRAKTLSIPVFNLERFLYFIGYKTMSSRPGAF
jgi:hypothetical protein